MNLRLVWQAESGESQTIALSEGPMNLGREAANELVIEDESVSLRHCEIQVSGTEARVRDLDSSNGTLIDGQPIAEAVFRHGQRLTLGSVNFLFLSETAGESSQAEAQIPIPPRLAVPRAIPRAAPGMAPRTRSAVAGASPSSVSPDAPFLTLVAGAFAYPFLKQGAVLLVTGAVFFSVLDWAKMLASAAPLLGLVAILILSVFSTGFLFAYMKSVVSSSIDGSDTPPNWPDITEYWEDVVAPCFQLVALVMVMVMPGVLLMNLVNPWLGLVVLLGGLFCLPMALLTVSLADSLTGLNPVLIFGWIGRMFGAYAVAWLIFLLFVGLRVGFAYVAESLPIPLLPTLIVNALVLYGLTVEMRVLGLMYFKHRHRLE